MTQPAPGPGEPLPGAAFLWTECHNLLPTDATGGPVRQPTSWPAVQVQVRLQMPLLYWSERRRWMWHKKCAFAPLKPAPITATKLMRGVCPM